METIECAAIRHKGVVYHAIRPGRHHHVFQTMHALGLHGESMREQGFLTSSGRFVDRREGLAIASAAGQIKDKTFPHDILFSEDMW